MSEHVTSEVQEETHNLEQADTEPRDFLCARSALAQISAHKKESIIAAVALLIYSVVTVFALRHTGKAIDAYTGFELGIVPIVLLVLAILSFAAILYALFSVAKPLRKRIITFRLVVLAAGILLVTAVTSLALGLLARLLFAGDPTRFEFAKTGVDHASGLLAVIVAAIFYVFLAACLKEKKIELHGFGKSFGVLLVWIAGIYIIKYLIFSVFADMLFHTVELSAVSIILVSVSTVLSTLFALWYMSLALAAHEKFADPENNMSLSPDEELDASMDSDVSSDMDADASTDSVMGGTQ